jgi:hypothetical protein
LAKTVHKRVVVVWAGENRAKSPVHPHKDATGCIWVSEKSSLPGNSESVGAQKEAAALPLPPYHISLYLPSYFAYAEFG